PNEISEAIKAKQEGEIIVKRLPEGSGSEQGSAGLAGDDPRGMCRTALRSFDLSLTVPPHRSGLSEKAHQGDLRDACPLRLPAGVLHPAPRWLGREPEEGLQALKEDGPAAEEQDAQASGQGEAVGGSHDGSPAERCV